MIKGPLPPSPQQQHQYSVRNNNYLDGRGRRRRVIGAKDAITGAATTITQP
jgi:hypothetical protein